MQIQFIIAVMGLVHIGLCSTLYASGPLNKGRSLNRDKGRKQRGLSLGKENKGSKGDTGTVGEG